MVIVKQVLAVVLAAVVGNPLCCCTAASIFGHAAEPDRAPACCAAKCLPESQPASPGEDEPACPCDKDSTIVVETKPGPLDPAWGYPAVVGAEARFSGLVLVDPAGVPNLVAAADLPPPPRPWRLYCRYLL